MMSCTRLDLLLMIPNKQQWYRSRNLCVDLESGVEKKKKFEKRKLISIQKRSRNPNPNPKEEDG
jgi:hypothetical protein